MIQKCLKCKVGFKARPSEIKKGKDKYCSRDCFLKYINKGKFIACSRCKKNKWFPTNRWKRNKSGLFFCSRVCNFEYQKGEKSTLWKGGKYETFYLHGKGNTWKHRIIAEACLKRKLKKGEIVHHIDENKRNNHPSNLYVFETMEEHLRAHREGWSKTLKSNLYETSVDMEFRES